MSHHGLTCQEAESLIGDLAASLDGIAGVLEAAMHQDPKAPAHIAPESFYWGLATLARKSLARIQYVEKRVQADAI